MYHHTLHHIVDTLLRTLSRAVGFAEGDFVPERRLLRAAVDAAVFDDGAEAFQYVGGTASGAAIALREINTVCCKEVSELSMRRCLMAYTQFCENAQNMDDVCRCAERLLRQMLYVNWQAEQGLEMLKERLVLNLKGAAEYVFANASKAWEEVKAGMKVLMKWVGRLINRLWTAATTRRETTKHDTEQRISHYRRCLSTACDKVSADREREFRAQVKAYDSPEELIGLWWTEHERHSGELGNRFIDFNPHHRRTEKQMVAFVNSVRHIESLQDELDQYFRYDAFFVFLERMAGKYGAHSPIERGCQAEGQTTIFYTNDVNITTAQGCNIIENQNIKK